MRCIRVIIISGVTTHYWCTCIRCTYIVPILLVTTNCISSPAHPVFISNIADCLTSQKFWWNMLINIHCQYNTVTDECMYACMSEWVTKNGRQHACYLWHSITNHQISSSCPTVQNLLIHHQSCPLSSHEDLEDLLHLCNTNTLSHTCDPLYIRFAVTSTLLDTSNLIIHHHHLCFPGTVSSPW